MRSLIFSSVLLLIVSCTSRVAKNIGPTNSRHIASVDKIKCSVTGEYAKHYSNVKSFTLEPSEDREGFFNVTIDSSSKFYKYACQTSDDRESISCYWGRFFGTSYNAGIKIEDKKGTIKKNQAVLAYMAAKLKCK